MNNPTNGMGTTTTTTDSSLVDSDHVQGTAVFDPSGKDIGTIKRLIIDKVSGRVVYTVAQFGGFLGLGGKEYTIPWQKLDYDTSLGGFRTDITEAQLRGAPDFYESGSSEYPDRERETTFNAYYGSENYWDE